jgi:hypothetical protein
MIDSQYRFERLWDLLDQEMAAYQILLQDMRGEWECLKKDDPLTLSSLLQAKRLHIDKIKEIRVSMDEVLSKLLVDNALLSQKTILDLIPHLSNPQADRIRNYQKTMNGIKEQIVRINEKNRRFIQEVLNYLKDLFSLLISSVQEEPVYVKDGRKISPPLPASWMSKQV